MCVLVRASLGPSFGGIAVALANAAVSPHEIELGIVLKGISIL